MLSTCLQTWRWRTALCAHAAIVHLQGGRLDSRETSEPAKQLNMSKCSAFLVNGSVFQVDEGIDAQLIVSNCVFSKPNKSFFFSPFAALIQQAGASDEIKYKGQGNRYHNIGPFWVRSTNGSDPAPLATTWKQFTARQEQVGDQESRVVTANPWADESPLRFFKMTPPQPQNAFLVDVRSPDMRQVDSWQNHLVGVEYCSWGLTVEDKLPEIEQPAPADLASRDKIVDPTVSEGGNGVYRTLSAAIAEAMPGDVIQIRHTGRLPVEPVSLEQPDKNLTIKPAKDMHPVLTFGPTSQADAAMFHLHGGKLRLERLEFLLHPSSDTFTAQAIVDMVADGQCTFSDCAVTLEELRPVRLALAVFTDPSGVMKMVDAPAQQQVPQVHVERCFVRGDGDLVAVRASRALVLDVKESLVVLGGSFLNVDGNAKEPQPAATTTVTLNHVTTYLTDHLVRLAAASPRALAPVQVWPEDCLFASAGTKPFVHLDGIEGGDTAMKPLFSWEQGRHNAYSKSMPMLDPKARADDVPPASYGQDKWRTSESDALFTTIRFAVPPAESSLASVSPASFRVAGNSDIQTYGATVDLLPSARLESIR